MRANAEPPSEVAGKHGVHPANGGKRRRTGGDVRRMTSHVGAKRGDRAANGGAKLRMTVHVGAERGDGAAFGGDNESYRGPRVRLPGRILAPATLRTALQLDAS
jgi:hypothetical protein